VSGTILIAAAGTARTRRTARMIEPDIKTERLMRDMIGDPLSPFKNNSLTEIFFSVLRLCSDGPPIENNAEYISLKGGDFVNAPLNHLKPYDLCANNF
jgi:hypothetical protein